MWASAVMAAIYLVLLVTLTLPASLEYGSPGIRNVGIIIWTGLFALAATLVYLLGHLIYGIYWLGKVRGRGYKPGALGTAVLVGVPTLVGIVFFGGVFFVYLTAGAFSP